MSKKILSFRRAERSRRLGHRLNGVEEEVVRRWHGCRHGSYERGMCPYCVQEYYRDEK